MTVDDEILFSVNNCFVYNPFLGQDWFALDLQTSLKGMYR